jgi:hypothetical protein
MWRIMQNLSYTNSSKFLTIGIIVIITIIIITSVARAVGPSVTVSL